jgi:hypothetical protein
LLKSAPTQTRQDSAQATWAGIPFFLFGGLSILFGLGMYFVGMMLGIVRLVLVLGEPYRRYEQAIVWYSGIPFTLGLILAAIDLGLLLPNKRKRSRRVGLEPVADRHAVVVLTAYNDEESIADAVADFKAHPMVARVIVVENNSRDRTAECARAAGATVVTETKPGYGRCVYRCFEEGLAQSNAEVIVLCEGDMTFRARDLEKLLAYIDDADIVNGTRIVEQLREYSTQLSTFMYYGNFFVAKLLEL